MNHLALLHMFSKYNIFALLQIGICDMEFGTMEKLLENWDWSFDDWWLGNFFSTIPGTRGISPLPTETALCTKIPLTTFMNPNDENLHDGPELLLRKLRRDVVLFWFALDGYILHVKGGSGSAMNLWNISSAECSMACVLRVRYWLWVIWLYIRYMYRSCYILRLYRSSSPRIDEQRGRREGDSSDRT